jgi:RNA polymerase sigma factor (sigma-70 family)
MAGRPSGRVLRQVQRLYNFGAVGALSDAELLDWYVARHDEAAEAAFEQLVIRHGTMVLRVCRSLLHDAHDAEDAFQAVFLVLANRAGSIRRNGSVASWLFGVAHRVSTRARRSAARRRTLHQLVAERTSESYRPSENELDWEILHEEIHRLPERLRAPVVLCYLQGLTYAEAAHQLGVSAVAIQGRLARVRGRLRQRLALRGMVFSGSSVAALLSAGSASASAPPALVASTIKAASLLAAGQAASIVTAKVAALTDGVMKAMFMTKIKSVLAVVLVVGLALGGIGLGVGLSSNPAAVAQAETPKEAPVKKESPASPVATKKDEKPPHIVEKTDMKGVVHLGPHKIWPEGKEPTEETFVVVNKGFFSSMRRPNEIRFREVFDPRYLKKHGLTDRDIAFEFADSSRILNMNVADDNRTVLVVLEQEGGIKEAFVVRWVVYEGHLYISPEKAPDPKTGIFTPWILRTKVN